MIRAVFYKTGEDFTGFHLSGHSGLAEAGKDIVCAAVTSAVRLTECSLNDVFHVGASVSVDEKSSEITIMIPTGISGFDRDNSGKLIHSFYIYLSALQTEYPKNIEIKVYKPEN